MEILESICSMFLVVVNKFRFLEDYEEMDSGEEKGFKKDFGRNGF